MQGTHDEMREFFCPLDNNFAGKQLCQASKCALWVWNCKTVVDEKTCIGQCGILPQSEPK